MTDARERTADFMQGPVMDLRRVFIPTYYFPPSAASASFRLLGFARHLPKSGWSTDILFPGSPDDPALRDQVPDGTHIEVVPFPKNKVLGKLAPYDCWLPFAWRGCHRMVRSRKPSAILTSGPPHHIHLLGLSLKRRHGLPWVADFRDPWITGADLAGGNPARPGRGEAWLERAVFRNADAIIMNAPNAAARVRSVYPAWTSKVHVITNGYDPEQFGDQGDRPVSEDGPLTIIHPGQIYSGRDPRPFLAAVRTLALGRPPGSRPIRVELIGNLNHRWTDELKAEVDRLELGSVIASLGHMPYGETLARMARASILLLLDSPGRLVGAPAKLYEYIGANRPILALAEAEGDVAWVLATSGRLYRIAQPTDPDAIHSALVGLIGEIESGPTRPGIGADRRFFTREALAGRLATILDDVSRSEAAP
jgi:glycosyltransferase involved in cell wall biosynthesis